MAATIEVKYFNSYWLKKLKSVQTVKTRTTKDDDDPKFNFIFESGLNYFLYYSGPDLDYLIDFVGPGQKLSFTYPLPPNPAALLYTYTIVGVDAAIYGGLYRRIYVDKEITVDFSTISNFVPLTFGSIVDFNYVPGSKQITGLEPKYIGDNDYDWLIEESRIRGGYNNLSTDLGVKAYIVEESAARQNRISSLIYSGIFNSRTGINNTNQFSVAEDITTSLDPAQGSIQKLYAEDTNLIIFQENKVSRGLIDKDAIYTAEGEALTTSGASVIGQIQAYAGNYGISTNPESFTVYGYRKYFADRNKGLILRLSQDGITEISSYGMRDYFRDNLASVGVNGRVVGSWDMHNKQYVVSMQPASSAGAFRPNKTGYVYEYQTLTFDEDSAGWTSKFSFKPDAAFSMRNEYYSAYYGNIWKHYSYNVPYCNFYGTQYTSSVSVVLNPEPSFPKTFQTINYEGASGWALTEIYTDSNVGVPVSSAVVAYDLSNLQDQLFLNNFKSKENKYHATILNNTEASGGTVVYGQSMSGITGFYATGTFVFPDTSQLGVVYTKPTTLFAVSSTFSQSLGN